jgi:hypothetical protein
MPKANKLRPHSADEDEAEDDGYCKIDVAIAVVGMFSDLRKACVCGEGKPLTPREEATYAAALYRLETYIDSRD